MKKLIFTSCALVFAFLHLKAQSGSLDDFKVGNDYFSFEDTLICGPADSFITKHKEAFSLSAFDSFPRKGNIYYEDYAFTDTFGFTYYRYGQYHKGYRVVGHDARVITHHNRIYTLLHDLRDSLDLLDSFAISAEVASGTAMDFFADTATFAWQDTTWQNYLRSEENDSTATYLPPGELVYYAPIESDDLRMCWFFNMIAIDTLPLGYNIYVDALSDSIIGAERTMHLCSNTTADCQTEHNGAQATLQTDQIIFNKYQLKNCADNIETKETSFNAFGVHNHWTRVSNTTHVGTNWGTDHQAATTVHWAANWAHDYFSSIHNLHGPSGSTEKVRIHVIDNLNGISGFDDSRSYCYMIFGLAFNSSEAFNSIDVVGHEYSHWISSVNSGLTNRGENGAIAEGFGDVFGTAVERHAKGGTYEWDMFEDDHAGLAIRNMETGIADVNGAPDQAIMYDPTQLLDGNFADPTNFNNDDGGVHINSGILAKCFQLLVEGGEHSITEVEAFGIGFEKAEKIFFSTMTSIGSMTDFTGTRQACLNAAWRLYGKCSYEYKAVARAWHAVGVGEDIGECMGMIPNGKIYVPLADLDSLELFATFTGEEELTYTWDASVGVTYSTEDSTISITHFVEQPGFYDVTVTGIGSSDTFVVVKTIYILNPTDEICTVGQFNKRNPFHIKNLEEIDFQIFPNPSTGLFTVIVLGNSSEFVVNIFNSTGHLVRNKSYMDSSEFEVDLNNLVDGIYVIQIKAANRSMVKKIIKNN
ncbi:MAG: Zn-dependent metalloprotease [Bacteroidia bacterium]|jgi:Zn-dependent metalloprotease